MGNYTDAVRPLKRVFGHEAATAINALKLKVIQSHLADGSIARSTINLCFDSSSLTGRL